jgi:hypothetical protein
VGWPAVFLGIRTIFGRYYTAKRVAGISRICNEGKISSFARWMVVDE